ncbi:MAG TPA: oligosaccharide flippase family protein [Faecalibacter sp.]
MYKKLFNETLIYGLGAILPRLIIFVLNPLYNIYLENTEYSKFSQLYAAISFLNVFLTFGFETAFFRYAPEKNMYQKVLNTSFWFMFSNAAIFLILLYIFVDPIASFSGYEGLEQYLIWFGWIAFFDTLCVIPFAVLRFKGRPILYSGIRVIQTAVQALLTFAMFALVSPKLLESIHITDKLSIPFLTNLLASVLGVILLFNVIKSVRFNFDWSLFKKMFHYGYPIMIAGFAFILNENFDKLIHRFYISEADAGSYSGCYKLAMIMTMFVTAYRMGVEPFLFKVAKNEDSRKTYAEILFFFSVICNLVVLGILVNLTWITKIFVPNTSYHIAMDIVPIILVANLFYGIYYNLSTWYKITDKTYVGTVVSSIGGLITILMNILLINQYGFMVSAWATLIAYGTMMIISYLWGQKSYPIPYQTGKILIYMIVAIAMACANYYLLDSNLIIGNLLLISYIALLIFAEKSTIKKLIRR